MKVTYVSDGKSVVAEIEHNSLTYRGKAVVGNKEAFSLILGKNIATLRAFQQFIDGNPNTDFMETVSGEAIVFFAKIDMIEFARLFIKFVKENENAKHTTSRANVEYRFAKRNEKAIEETIVYDTSRNGNIALWQIRNITRGIVFRYNTITGACYKNITDGHILVHTFASNKILREEAFIKAYMSIVNAFSTSDLHIIKFAAVYVNSIMKELGLKKQINTVATVVAEEMKSFLEENTNRFRITKRNISVILDANGRGYKSVVWVSFEADIALGGHSVPWVDTVSVTMDPVAAFQPVFQVTTNLSALKKKAASEMQKSFNRACK